MAKARGEASNVRDEARAEGRKIVDDMRGRAPSEVASTLQQADEELTEQAASRSQADLQSSVEDLSATLASRVLGVEINRRSDNGVRGGSAMSTFIGQLVGFAVIVFMRVALRRAAGAHG